ncbi:hypothetical protein ACFLYB_05415 [Chloroflexota bacterium]
MAKTPRTSIGLSVSTKDKLKQIRAIGQSYDGLLRELVLMREKQDETANAIRRMNA